MKGRIKLDICVWEDNFDIFLYPVFRLNESTIKLLLINISVIFKKIKPTTRSLVSNSRIVILFLRITKRVSIGEEIDPIYDSRWLEILICLDIRLVKLTPLVDKAALSVTVSIKHVSLLWLDYTACCRDRSD